MQILALILKKFLSLKNLNKPYAGGLSSYSLIQMLLAIFRLIERENQYFSSKTSISMVFKKFVWEFGFNFVTMSKAITQTGDIEDRNNLQYILHTPICTVNTKFDGDTANHGNACDCGYKLVHSQSHSQDDDDSSEQQETQNNLIEFISKIMNTDDKKKASAA